MMNRRLKLFIFLILQSFISITSAQELSKRNGIELHLWQIYAASGHDGNVLGLSYLRTLSPKFDFCGEGGVMFYVRRGRPSDNIIYYLPYFSIGGKYFFRQERGLNAEVHFLYNTNLLYNSDQKLRMKIGVGYNIKVDDEFYVNLNSGLLLSIESGLFYGGINLGHRF